MKTAHLGRSEPVSLTLRTLSSCAVGLSVSFYLLHEEDSLMAE